MADQDIQESIFYQTNYNQSYSNLIQGDFECPSGGFRYVVVSNNTVNSQKTIDQLSSQVSSSEDVENLLDHVNWRLFIYLCGKTCQNFTYSKYELHHMCSNSSCCLSDSINDVSRSFPSCGNTSCTNFINSSSPWYSLLLVGLFCLLGNTVVILDKIISLLKKQHKDKEIQIYHTLVLNLALADLLMGVYLTAVSFEIKHKIAIGVYFSESSICNLLGIISTVSSHVSLTVLLLISSYRLVGVLVPYKRQHYRLVIILISLTWINWTTVAALPLVPLEPFKTVFTYGMAKDRLINRNSLITFGRFVPFIKEKIMPHFIMVPEVKSILQAVIKFPTSSVLEKFSNALGWIHAEREKWHLIGFYDSKYLCFTNFNVGNKDHQFGYFHLALVFYNLVVSIAILVAYVLVSTRLSDKNDGLFCFAFCRWCIPCCSCKNYSTENEGCRQRNAARLAENRTLFTRISIILLTDIMCWIPVCITSLVIWRFPVQNRKELIEIGIVLYGVTLFLVPLNSILNPYIYSFRLWMLLFKTLRNKLYQTKITRQNV